MSGRGGSDSLVYLLLDFLELFRKHSDSVPQEIKVQCVLLSEGFCILLYFQQMFFQKSVTAKLRSEPPNTAPISSRLTRLQKDSEGGVLGAGNARGRQSKHRSRASILVNISR